MTNELSTVLSAKHSGIFQTQFPEAYEALKDYTGALRMTRNEIVYELHRYAGLAATRGLICREIITYWFVLNAQEINEGEMK